jgi:hypothetical protein
MRRRRHWHGFDDSRVATRCSECVCGRTRCAECLGCIPARLRPVSTCEKPPSGLLESPSRRASARARHYGGCHGGGGHCPTLEAREKHGERGAVVHRRARARPVGAEDGPPRVLYGCTSRRTQRRRARRRAAAIMPAWPTGPLGDSEPGNKATDGVKPATHDDAAPASLCGACAGIVPRAFEDEKYLYVQMWPVARRDAKTSL